MSSWRIYRPQHAILLRTLNQAASIKSSTWFEISSCQRWTRPCPIQTASYVWLVLSQLQRTAIQLGPESVKTLTETCVYYTFKLAIHLNFTFMWNVANKKKNSMRPGIQTRTGRTQCTRQSSAKRRIWESMFVSISSIKSNKRRGARSVPCGTRFFFYKNQ